MILKELPKAWRPEGSLTVVAHIARGLEELSELAGFTLVADEDDFSTFHAVHLLADGRPLVLLEYDPTPGYVYLLMHEGGSAVQSTAVATLELLGVSDEEVPWVAWEEK